MLSPQTDQPFTPIPHSKALAEQEARRIQRISLPLPIQVEVRIDKDVTWSEVTRLSDVSAFGAGFTLKRPIKQGRMVKMTIPMPRQLRSFDFSEPQYRVWGVVRRCISIGRSSQDPEFSIGVAFTGRKPPDDYLEHPSMLYDLAHRQEDSDGLWRLTPLNLMARDSHLPSDFRKQTRFLIPEPLILEVVDPNGTVTATEQSVSENISLGGAAVFTSLVLEVGTFLRVTSERFNVTILSVVRGSRIGSNGIPRLHIEFIDQFFPLDGIS